MGTFFAPGASAARPRAVLTRFKGRETIAVFDGTSGSHGCITATVLPLSNLSVALAVTAGLLLAAPVQAAPAPASGGSAPPAASTPETKPATPPKPGGKKVISLDDEFLVEGRLEKPSAFYVLRRSKTDYDWARLDAVFTPLVLESVQDPLF
jgi:hypothetical protein